MFGRDRRLGGEIGAFKVDIIGVFVSSFWHSFFARRLGGSYVVSSLRFMVGVYSLRIRITPKMSAYQGCGLISSALLDGISNLDDRSNHRAMVQREPD